MLVPATAVAAGTWCEIISHHQKRDRSSMRHGQLRFNFRVHYMVRATMVSFSILYSVVILTQNIYNSVRNISDYLGMEEDSEQRFRQTTAEQA